MVRKVTGKAVRGLLWPLNFGGVVLCFSVQISGYVRIIFKQIAY